MAEIAIGAAAFSGVRFILARPGLVLGWIAVRILLGIVVALYLSDEFAPQLYAFRRDANGLTLWPVLVIVCVVILISESIFITAANRAMTASAPDAFLYFRIGPTEFRQLIINVFFGAWLVAAPLICLFSVYGVLTVTNQANHASLSNICFYVGCFIFSPIIIILTSARIFVISPANYDRGRIDISAIWKISRSQFWKIVLVMIICAMSIALLFILFIFVDRLLNSTPGANSSLLPAGMIGMPGPFTRGNGMSFYPTPAHIYADILRAIFGGLCLPLWLAPSVSIYRSLTAGAEVMGDSGESVADLFA